MAKFPGLTLTMQGINMIVKSQAGSELIFTKMQLGDGQVDAGEDLKVLTELKTACLTANISTIDTAAGNGQIVLTAIVSNADLEKGFFARELGVWAKIGKDGQEQLYAYSNAGNYTSYIPDKTEPVDENKIRATIVVGNASSISAVINASIVYVTKEMFDQHDSNQAAHGTLMKRHNEDENAHQVLMEKVEKMVSGIDLSPYAKVDSPTFTGIPTAPTASPGTNTLQIATTAFVRAAVTALVNSSPAALDTLKELADALGDDPNFAATMTNALAGKLATSASCNKNWNWAGQSGQPSWLWGGENGSDMYVYNPLNFHVSYADTAGSAGNSNQLGGSTLAQVLAQISATNTGGIIAASFGANGYVKWSNGFILQWGTGTWASTDTTITFPIAFSSACYDVLTQMEYDNDWDSNYSTNRTTVNFNFHKHQNSATTNSWIAVGR